MSVHSECSSSVEKSGISSVTQAILSAPARLLQYVIKQHRDAQLGKTLRRLDDHLLRDMGLSREGVEARYPDFEQNRSAGVRF